MIKVGDIVEFTPTYETEPVRGTVVKHTRYAWCVGANTIVVFVDRSSGSNLFQFSQLGGNYTNVDPAPDDQVAQRLAAAKAAYHTHLSQYPVWRERFAAGGSASW